MKRHHNLISTKNNKCRNRAEQKRSRSVNKEQCSQDQELLYFSTLPMDLLRMFMLYFDSSHILKMFKTLKNTQSFATLATDQQLWKTLWHRDISSFIILADYGYKKYRDVYEKTKYITHMRQIRRNLDRNDHNMFFLNTYVKEAMTYLVSNGYDIMFFSVPKLADMSIYFHSIKIAVKYLYLHFIELLLEKLAIEYPYFNTTVPYNDIMLTVIKHGDLDIAKLMLEKSHYRYYDRYVEEAASNGHLDVVKFIVEKSEREDVHIDYRAAAQQAATKGHLDVVEFILDKGYNDYNDLMCFAAPSGKIDIIRLLVERGANNYNETMREAGFFGSMDVIELMLAKGANNYNETMLSAVWQNKINVIRLMLKKGADNYNEVMDKAAERGQIGIVKLMLERGANNYKQVIKTANQQLHENIVELVLTHINKKK